MKHIAALLAVLLLSLNAAGPAHATQTSGGRITVTGQGLADATPDMATLTLGVTQRAKQASIAMGRVSDAVADILARLAQADIAPRDIQTRRLTLNPTRTNRASGSADFIGYTASNTVAIRVRDLDRLGVIMESVLTGGANVFNGLQFSVQDPAPLLERARKDAVADAMARAALYAKAAGVTLGPVLAITEQGGNSRPVLMEMASVRGAGAPVAPGEVTISATVTMVFAIAE